MRNWQTREDARSLTLIALSALVAFGVTASVISAGVNEVRRDVRVEVRAARADQARPRPVAPPPVPASLTGDGPIYGTVVTKDGRQLAGFIRWDRNEGSWADFLDADKDRGATQSGIRFGHVLRITPDGSRSAELLLRSGERVRLSSQSTDLGSGLRALVVETAGGPVELDWSDLAFVDFSEAPAGAAPSSERLHGTLTTRDGRAFTGYIAWDTDEVFASDVLDGDDEAGVRQQIPFGSVASIARRDSRSAHIVLNTGRQMILDGSNDVNGSIRGIAVSDPLLGEVKLSWDEFDRVRFHPRADAEPAVFDGGRRIHGTVVTRSGADLTGDVRWDADEAYTWEVLNGKANGVELQIEFGRIARIVKEGNGATVYLGDGRVLALTGSNDVDRSNRGVVVETEAGVVEVDWRDFVELRLER